MITAGITGGIGSGKSTVCGWWAEWGARVLFADDLAKELMVMDDGLRRDLVRAFGPQTYHKDGSLNKPHLIGEAFQKNRVEELNKLVHPVVHREARSRIEQARREGVDLFVYEAALLLKNGRPDFLDRVVLLLAAQERRIDWVSKRDEQSENDIRARIEKQQDFEKLADLADYVLRNDGSLSDLKQKSRELFNTLLNKNY